MSDELTPVNHYGIHKQDGVMYLHQGRASTNFIGLRNPSPFLVQTKKSRACPHIINTASPVPDRIHWDLFLSMFHDPLVLEMLPVPKERGSLVPYFNDPQNELAMDLVILSRLSSPIYPVIQGIEKKNVKQFLEELTLSNIAPLVLTGVMPEHYDIMIALAMASRTLPRKLIFTGCSTVPTPPPLTRMNTHIWDFDDLTIAGLPMESIGGALVRRYCRGEVLEAPYPRRSA